MGFADLAKLDETISLLQQLPRLHKLRSQSLAMAAPVYQSDDSEDDDTDQGGLSKMMILLGNDF